jgi:hypothetical protein
MIQEMPKKINRRQNVNVEMTANLLQHTLAVKRKVERVNKQYDR